MSTPFTRTSRQLLVRALCSLAVTACVGADEATELGVYDQQAQSSRRQKPDAAHAADPADSGATSDAGAICAEPDARSGHDAGTEDAGNQDDVADADKAPVVAFAPIAYDDPELRCYSLLAHTASDKTQAYSVSMTKDQYVNFTFRAPWQGTQFVRSLRPIIDAETVIHRFRLFANASATPEGVALSDRNHKGASLIAAWAPNGDDVYFRKSAGMRVGDDVSYTLEVHYNNLTAAAFADHSGIELCVTPQKPSLLVGLAHLGAESAAGNTLSGLCAPSDLKSAHIVAIQPQFDVRTKSLSLAIQRSQAGLETVIDKVVAFDYQRSYEANVEVRPGDTLSTTCTSDRPPQTGPSVSDSACNLYVYHWPAHALVNSAAADAPEGVDSCLQ